MGKTKEKVKKIKKRQTKNTDKKVAGQFMFEIN